MKGNSTTCDFPTSDSWVILSPIEQSIKRKIEAVGVPLKDWDINIYRGVLTGCNEAFIITTEKRDEILANCQTEEEKKRTAELIRPILRGRDIKRYGYDWAGRWLINTHNGIKDKIPRINIEDYPAVKAHLDQFWDKIRDRADQGDTPYNLRNCAYMEDFSKPKIVYMEIQTDNPKEGYPFPCFSYDEGNKIVLNTAYIMSSNSINILYILGVLNSSVGRMLSRLYVTQLQERQFRMLAQYLIKFPIPEVSEVIQKQVSNYTHDIIENKKCNVNIQLNSLVYGIYNLNYQEIKHIEEL